MAKKQPLEVAKTRSFKVADLRTPSYNPNIMEPAEQRGLETSMKDFGVVEYPVINTHQGREGVIVGGSHRVQVAREAGQATLTCIVVDLTLDRERELNLRLNKHRGNPDGARMAEHFEVDELTAVGFDQSSLVAWNMLTEAGAGDLEAAAASVAATEDQASAAPPAPEPDQPVQPGGPAAGDAEAFADAQAVAPPPREDHTDVPPPTPAIAMSQIAISGPEAVIGVLRTHLRDAMAEDEQYLGVTLARLLGLEIPAPEGDDAS